ncbi:MAG TPA: aspartate ammonia-lyase [Gemmatimonadota bacterium]|nr:aspartate ammonia-lyase [Gemmatimonadota bacterium]
MTTRKEKDSLGSREVPAEVYWGIQTLRATENFPVSGLREPGWLIDAYMYIKKAAALTHLELGVLDEERARAIVQACDDVLAGQLRDQFVVDVFQAGAGVSFHMNVNEVVTNRALEILGEPRASYGRIHPNDHVNMSQSTNDTFPTAMHLSVLLAWRDFEPVLEALADAFHAKGEEFADAIKSGRTHLQDAVPVTLGQEMHAYGAALDRSVAVIDSAVEALVELPIGGNAAGTGINLPDGYRPTIIRHLSELTGFDLLKAADPRERLQSHQPITGVSAALRNLALELIRIANDLRLLDSGPLTGLKEITLPPRQPGSSIMPGKVNPVMPECLNQIAFHVVGADLTVAMAAQAGQLEINVMQPVMIWEILFSIEILKNFLEVFRTGCVEGIVADRERMEEYAHKSPSLATALNPVIGYARAAEIVKKALAENRRVSEVALEETDLGREKLAKILSPENLTGQLEREGQ